MPDSSTQRRYRFGVFEVDTATGELRRKGIRVRLNEQPFQLLLILLTRPGQLVTREEIAQALWPSDTFVDYEHGVNSAVNRIREALGDSAANPLFIETLARRGYRFIAPVHPIELGETSDSAAASEAVILPADAAGVPAEAEFSGVLTTPEDLPEAPGQVVQGLFIVFQLMYLGFYIGALANLAEIQDLLAPFPRAAHIYLLLVVSAGILIPVRAFLLFAALFRAPGFRHRFLRIWGFVLVADVLWALSPFLLLHHINFGLALACTALLVYAPFVQRSLVLMGAGRPASEGP